MSAQVLAASEWTYVWWSYGVVIGVLVAFAAWTIARGRRVGRQLPPEDRRWL
ncbi:MAG: heme exporter protein CcmD [Actinobacteria bacterium]|nr:heme exporter protein CcmD [Actinomycetota bacterium]